MTYKPHFWLSHLVLGAVLVTAQNAGAAPTAEPALAPTRVALECEGTSRTKACPNYLLSFIEASPLLLASPRAGAQVVLYAAVTPVANIDRFHLRFVGNVPRAPAEIEIDVDVNTRGTDDEQRAQLEPAFVRGVALFVAARNPEAVEVKLALPKTRELASLETSPWGMSVSLSSSGNWSKKYREANGSISGSLMRTTKTSNVGLSLGTDGGMSKRPPLVVNDTTISLDTREWAVHGSAFASRNLSDHLAIGASTNVLVADPKGQFRRKFETSAGITWDLYPSDDPRGNVLAVAYVGSLSRDVYNFPNELGERSALYPMHILLAAAQVRSDTLAFGLKLVAAAELLHPTRRSDLSFSPSIEWRLGDHVDLALSFSLGKRVQPQPVIPEDDYQAQGRADYAQPLYAEGKLTLKVHFDATNGERNNRFMNF